MRPTLGSLLHVNQFKKFVAPGPFTTCFVNAVASIKPTSLRTALASSNEYFHHAPRRKLLDLVSKFSGASTGP